MSGGRELLVTLKANATAKAPCLCIPVGLPVEAVLRPVATAAGRVDAYDVHVLTEWRNRFVSSFLTEFVATETRTEQWLTEVVGPDSTRILFMLDDTLGATVGYLGLAFIDWENLTGEADAIVRGADTAPGVMARAMFTLLDWAREQLGLKSVGARVRSDNSALQFFLKFAVETKRVPLRKVEEPDMIRWVEDATLGETLGEAPVSLVYITFTR
jgi:RimJ/RimL family protein N-acetyltransferase